MIALIYFNSSLNCHGDLHVLIKYGLLPCKMYIVWDNAMTSIKKIFIAIKYKHVTLYLQLADT